MMPLPRTVRLGSFGPDVEAHKRAMHRYLHTGGLIELQGKPLAVRRTFGPGARALAIAAARAAYVPADGKVGPALYLKLRTAGAYDALADALLGDYEPPPAIPQLGPVVPGGMRVLDHDLTHATGGLPGFPAFDDGFSAGQLVIAPEPVQVTQLGRARRRDGRPNGLSLWATGASGIVYWMGHVARPVTVGTRAKLGGRLAIVSANHESPHLHVGIDASALIGRELEHHTDYTHGGPTVREQLERAARARRL